VRQLSAVRSGSFAGSSTKQAEAYRLGALALLASVIVMATALGFEYIGGFAPCPLCLQQRYAYYIAIPGLFVALVLLTIHHANPAAILLLLLSLVFLGNAGLGIYHAGAEWKFWPGPETCAGGGSIATTAGDLLKGIKTAKVVRCDEAAIRVLGLSMAGWNVIASFCLWITIQMAAFAASDRHDQNSNR
jgi:disulfide bond formation protein DsbB